MIEIDLKMVSETEVKDSSAFRREVVFTRRLMLNPKGFGPLEVFLPTQLHQHLPSPSWK